MTAEPTISARAAASRRWEALVVGAGPAGAVAARQLARRGRDVLLVERQGFPRHKVCGGCLSRHTMQQLGGLGLGSVVSDLGGVPLEGLEIGGWERRVHLRLPGGASVSRRAFDATLVDAAIEAGAEFLSGCGAELGPISRNSRSVALRVGAEELETIASVVVFAGGLGVSPFGEPPGARRLRRGAKTGMSLIVDDGPAAYRPGTIYMAVGSRGYAGVVRLEDGRLNVAAALERSATRHSGPGPLVSALLNAADFEAIPGLARHGWAGTKALGFRPRRVAGERVFVVGDAAGYVEPFTGEGIGWAIESAALLEPFALRAIDNWSTSLVSGWTRRHRRAVRRSQRTCGLIAAVLRRPWASRSLLAALTLRPSIAAPVVRRLHGAGAVGGAELPS